MYFARSEPEPKRQRKNAGSWLKELRSDAGLSQMQVAESLGLKYYTFVSQVENGFGRVPVNLMERWARVLGVEPSKFSKQLLLYYDPELYRLLFEVEK